MPPLIRLVSTRLAFLRASPRVALPFRLEDTSSESAPFPDRRSAQHLAAKSTIASVCERARLCDRNIERLYMFADHPFEEDVSKQRSGRNGSGGVSAVRVQQDIHTAPQ